MDTFGKRYPYLAQAARFVASDDPYGLGFASAWSLNAVDHVLELDRQLTPQTVITKETRRECGRAIIELEKAFAEFDRASQRRHEAEENHTLH